MGHASQILRSCIAFVVGLCYVCSTPVLALVLAVAAADHGHAHELEWVEHGGHMDLVLHHEHDPDDPPQHSGEEEDGCHRTHMAADSAVAKSSAAQLMIAPVTTGLPSHFEGSLLVGGCSSCWSQAQRRPEHPPPIVRSGTLSCLRTVVLRV
jgi:hypothetical protein